MEQDEAQEPRGQAAGPAEAQGMVLDAQRAAFERNPLCAVCGTRVPSAERANYLPAQERVVHVGSCTATALRRLFKRALRYGRI